MKAFFVPLIIALSLLGCTNAPVAKNQNHSVEPKYAQAYRYAYMALQEGNWPAYQKMMRKVIDLSTSEGASPERRAVFWYEYGRASGVVCAWNDAEFALTVARNLDAKTGGPVHQSLSELGRMNVARKEYIKAVDNFTLAMEAWADYHKKNSEHEQTSDLSRAAVLEDFAYALEQLGRQPSEVEKLRKEVAVIRNENAEKGNVHADQTPYATQCSVL